MPCTSTTYDDKVCKNHITRHVDFKYVKLSTKYLLIINFLIEQCIKKQKYLFNRYIFVGCSLQTKLKYFAIVSSWRFTGGRLLEFTIYKKFIVESAGDYRRQNIYIANKSK